VLCHVSVDKQDQDTSVEELSGEDSVGDGGQLLTVCVFSNPGNSLDDHGFENQVHSDDDEGN